MGKANLEAVRQQHISCVAQFEYTDMANADGLDATHHPTSTPKPCSQVQLSPSSPEASDTEMTDDHDFDIGEFKLPSAGNSATEDNLVDLATEYNSVVESGPT